MHRRRRKKSARNWREKDYDRSLYVVGVECRLALRAESQSHDPNLDLPQLLLSCDKDFAANGLVLGLYHGIRFVACNNIINKSSEEVKFLPDFIRKSIAEPLAISRSVCVAASQ